MQTCTHMCTHAHTHTHTHAACHHADYSMCACSMSLYMQVLVQSLTPNSGRAHQLLHNAAVLLFLPLNQSAAPLREVSANEGA